MDSSHSVEGLDAGKDGESTEKRSQDHRSSTAVESTPSDVDSAAEDLRQTETVRAEENKAGEGGDEADTAGAGVADSTPHSGDQEGLSTGGGEHGDTALQNNVGAETVREDGEETHSVSAGQGAGGDMVVEQRFVGDLLAGGEDGESIEKGSQDHRSSTVVKSTPSDVDSAAEDLRQTESDRAEVNKAGEGGDKADTAGADVDTATPHSGDQEESVKEGGKHADTAVLNYAGAEIQSEDASDKTTKTEAEPPAEAAPTAGCDTGDTGSKSKKAKEQEGITQTTEVEETEQRAPSETKSTQHLPVGLAIGAVLLLVFAVFVPCLWPAPEPEKPNLDKVEVFREEMAKVERSFRNQRSELWRRSRIHLQRHLKSAKPSEPVSLILVGGRKAERTLKCLAAHLAKAFSSSLNGSVLQVDGSSLANMDHDQVKLDLDNQLKEAFEGDKPAAVIHRLEELPPSSTLIFYRYCDHENAAYKDPFLAFTVLLPEDAVDPELSISQVEEMAHSHLHDKYLTSDQPDTFDRMDVDKLSGLWSRISHLILPVNMEEHMEKGGCDWE